MVLILEDDGLGAIAERPPIKMIGDRTRKHAPLYIAALSNEILGTVLMADRLDILDDDGPFIEVGGDIMGCRADHLHTAGVRLMIGLGALEARQEAVVNVDATPRKEACEVVGQDLHVTRKDDEFSARLIDQRLDPGFLLDLGFFRNRQVMEGDRTEVATVIVLA